MIKSNAIWNIAEIVKDGVITMDVHMIKAAER